MKRTILTISLTALFALCGLTSSYSQDQPKPQKDTVNIDTDAKPKTYYEIEDDNAAASGKEKGSGGTIAIILGAVVVVGAVAFFLLKKKK
jgi:hypothetical protein